MRNQLTSMSVRLIVGPEIFAGFVACCPLVNRSEYSDGTDGRTDGRLTVTLRFPPDDGTR